VLFIIKIFKHSSGLCINEVHKNIDTNKPQKIQENNPEKRLKDKFKKRRKR
jgi:hypothetical protein